RALLPEPDRASLEPARRRRLAPPGSAPAGAGHHQRRHAGARDRAAARRRRARLGRRRDARARREGDRGRRRRAGPADRRRGRAAGAGGQTGWLNRFAFVRAVRSFFRGTVVLAGGIADGRALRAAEVLGADLAYMGTKFIATRESMAPEAWKEMLVRATADDIVLTKAITGLETNILKESLVNAGLDPAALPERGALDVAKDIAASAPRRWKDIWSAGHSVSGVTRVLGVEELVAETERAYLLT